MEQLNRWHFVTAGLAAVPAEGESFSFNTPCMAISGDREAYLRMLEAFGGAGANCAAVSAALCNVSPTQLLQMVALLVHGGWLIPFTGQGSRSGTRTLNTALLQGVLAGAPYTWLGLPQATGAVKLPHLDLLLLGLLDKDCSETELAQGLVRTMKCLNQQFTEDGKLLSEPQQVLAHAQRIVASFQKTRLMSYRRLGLVDLGS